jgi:thiamine biosynthesis lipoprotein
MMNNFCKQILVFLLFFSSFTLFSQNTYKQKVKLMGSRFDITIIAKDEKTSDRYIKIAIDEIKRIERLISSWDSNSQTTLINKNAGIQPVKVDKELFELIERSIKISKLTDGAFDISYASMDRIWKFNGSMKTMPAGDAIKLSVANVGYHNIILDKSRATVYLKKKGMKIGFGAIGKGYAADKAKELLQEKGVKGGIINASGDMNTWGKQTNGKSWNVGITNPLNKNKIFALFPLDNSAVVTSGNYEKFVVFNGIRYTHIIDPRTGYPSHGIVSVSVFAPSAEIADALATSIFVMGSEVGLNLVNQMKGIECIIVEDTGRIISSNELNIDSKKH